MDRFLIQPDDEEIKLTFILARDIVENYDEKDILIVTATKNEMNLMGLRKFFGDKIVNRLKENQPIVSRGFSIRLESLRTFNQFNPRNSVIIGLYPGRSMFNKLDDSNAAAVIAVTDIIDEQVENWIETWNPQIYGENQKSQEKKLVDNCVVEEALKVLTTLMKRPHTSDIIIRSTNDREMAVELFKILVKYGEHYDPDEILKWARREGWTSEGADELKEMSQKIQERRRIRGSKIPIWTSKDIDRWRNNCKV